MIVSKPELETLDEPIFVSRDYTIRAVVRVCDLIDAIRDARDGLTLSDLSEISGLPKSSAFRYLTTLEGRHYVERSPQIGRYFLGDALFGVKSVQLEELIRLSIPHLAAARDATGESVHLAVQSGAEVLYVHVVESREQRRVAASIGDRVPIHATALGKCLASQATLEAAERLISGPLERITDMTITDPIALRKEIAEVRERGYAVDDREFDPGGRCVAVPLATRYGVAAVSVAAPDDRMPVESLPAAVETLNEHVQRIVKSMQ